MCVALPPKVIGMSLRSVSTFVDTVVREVDQAIVNPQRPATGLPLTRDLGIVRRRVRRGSAAPRSAPACQHQRVVGIEDREPFGSRSRPGQST